MIFGFEGDPNKVAHLKELEGAGERLHLFEANLIKDGSFDFVVHGCEGVFHTASPVLFEATDPQAELIEPAVNGTLNVLISCSKEPSVNRVVLTSSIAAVTFNRNPKGPDVIVDETSFLDPVFCEEIKLAGVVLPLKNIGGGSCIEILQRKWHRLGSNESWICDWSYAPANAELHS